MDARQVFDEAATGYDALRRKLIPCFDAFYGTAVELVQCDPVRPARILDLGAGTGLLAERLARRFPLAELTLLDVSEEMLARARARFGDGPRVSFRSCDLSAADLGGPWDAVVSALSIHHLPDEEKRALYGRILAALRPGGTFVNADNVLAEDHEVQARDRERWMAAVRASGIAEEDLAAALERTKVDVLAPLALQLRWLRELGYCAVDCAYKWHLFAVFSGRRPAG
jgi:tRNA (cmo5U34)-methyltransferase